MMGRDRSVLETGECDELVRVAGMPMHALVHHEYERLEDWRRKGDSAAGDYNEVEC